MTLPPGDRTTGVHHGVTPDAVVSELQDAGFEISAVRDSRQAADGDGYFAVIARRP
jgi:hypothetical protein